MQDKLISVVVALYNNGKYIDDCLESLINQTYKNIEIIVIDDGSTDEGPQKADEWKQKDDRIVVIHKENGGVSSAKNMGLDTAKGELIGFVDSDDYVAPDMYEILAETIETTGCDIARCGVERVTPDRRSINVVTYPERILTVSDAYREIDDGLFAMYTVSLSRRHVFDGVRFPIGRVYEDLATYFLQLERANGIAMVSQPLYKYRIVNKSIMHGKRSVRDLDRVEALYDRFLFFEKKGYKDLLSGTCVTAKNSIAVINDISVKTKADRERKKVAIEMYRYMYRHSEGKLPLQCTVCFYCPDLYLLLNRVCRKNR